MDSPSFNYLKKDKNVYGATPQLRAQNFFISSGSIELRGGTYLVFRYYGGSANQILVIYIIQG